MSPSWRQTIIAALLIAVVAAACVWFLEDFNRARTVETMREEWARFLAELPIKGEGTQQ